MVLPRHFKKLPSWTPVSQETHSSYSKDVTLRRESGEKYQRQIEILFFLKSSWVGRDFLSLPQTQES